ncbi:FAD-dependent oxidoreductase [Aureimonas fodinaquatilis]|uniref:FAD-dependent oxidoreductase n=1 Tax=Aureimonas fodinaquatilis TaxID=2565783 RepID=A0A5B0DXZ1_9HYPH|nr:FAD/NAD(P)-binding protein [Aureimonas fodinaquatilis]KAA0970430.1 FAD-dependent oxidoreductase [Aureimonas fodinaquatilis]
MNRPRILIAGGGATGVILARQLLSIPHKQFKVTIVEPREELGSGIAYSTNEPLHLLNTRVSVMSALHDKPDDFQAWLGTSGLGRDHDCDDARSFAPRMLYRLYLQSLLAPWLESSGDGRLQIIQDRCVHMSAIKAGVVATMASGRTELATLGVLATGHALAEPEATQIGLSPQADVLIIGTGLSMVDEVISLRKAGHTGKITALSRRGLLPRPHRLTTPVKLDLADIPLGAGVPFLLHWLRQTIRWTEAKGGDWRDVLDGLRPFNMAIWQALPQQSRASFVRHARTLWEVHRHRLPPKSDAIIRQAQADGQLTIIRGRVMGVDKVGDQYQVTIKTRGNESRRIFGRVIDCMGIIRDLRALAGNLPAALVEDGTARMDPLAIGLDIAPNCAIIARSGVISEQIFAAGPLTRAGLWEITAIPDIRQQCASLAQTLAEKLENIPQNA